MYMLLLLLVVSFVFIEVDISLGGNLLPQHQKFKTTTLRGNYDHDFINEPSVTSTKLEHRDGDSDTLMGDDGANTNDDGNGDTLDDSDKDSNDASLWHYIAVIDYGLSGMRVHVLRYNNEVIDLVEPAPSVKISSGHLSYASNTKQAGTLLDSFLEFVCQNIPSNTTTQLMFKSSVGM